MGDFERRIRWPRVRALNADELSPRIWEKGNGGEENRIVEVGVVELRASLHVKLTG